MIFPRSRSGWPRAVFCSAATRGSLGGFVHREFAVHGFVQWLGRIERSANTVANGDPLLSRMQGDRLIDASGLCSPCAPAHKISHLLHPPAPPLLSFSVRTYTTKLS